MTAPPRRAEIARRTAETDITLAIDIDGSGATSIATGIGFLDHMLTALGHHSCIDITLRAAGDLHIDAHHTTEDCGIALGQALRAALGEKRGISRFGHAVTPLDEAVVEAVVDISGRPYLGWQVRFTTDRIGALDTELVEEFFRALVNHAGMTLHLMQRCGHNNHHVAEAAFKATARALREAVELDPRRGGAVPSTKGVLAG
jgi:imidazoleglycerol-phosphate dehydratase